MLDDRGRRRGGTGHIAATLGVPHPRRPPSDVAFASAEAQTALRMLGREHALPFARTRYSVDPTDQDRDALETWRAAHPAHPSMGWDTVQPVMREEAHAAVQAALSRRPAESAVSER